MSPLVNRLSVGSLGVDSLAGSAAPPPGYTSQRDTASSIAVVINHDDEDELLKNSPTSPPSIHSDDPIHTLPSPYSIEYLRSHVQGQDQNPRLSLHQNYTHGYTQCTHAQARPKPQQQQRDTRLLSCDALHLYSPPQILSTDNPNGQSRPYSGYVAEEHWQPPVPADSITNQLEQQYQQHQQPYTDYSTLPTSPYRQNIHHPPLRVLSYPSSTDEGHYGCTTGNEEEGNRSSSPLINDQRMTIMMNNSTATILSPLEEPPLGCQSTHDPDIIPRRRRLPSLPNGTATRQAVDPKKTAVKKMKKKKKNPTINSSATNNKDHSTSPPLPPLPQTQPTNYVYISRKCNPSMPVSKSRRGWRRETVVAQQQQPNHTLNQIPFPPPSPPKLSSTSSSAITGTFTINPELYIPPSLLNAMEDPVFFRFKPSSSSDSTGETTSTRKERRTRRTNLRLEVENGGIDVDIHLVPTTTSTITFGEDEDDAGTCTGNRGLQQQDTSTPVTLQAQTTANSTSTTAFGSSSGPPSTTHPCRSTTTSSTQENPSGGTFSSRSTRGINTIPEVTQQNSSSSSRRDKNLKKQSRPIITTIDLQIKQAEACYQQCSLYNQDSVKMNGPFIAFPLIARIHAPNPRPPFHLFASTIDIPSTDSSPTTTTSNQQQQQQHTSHPKEPHTRNLQSPRAATLNHRPCIRNTTSQVFSEPNINPPTTSLPSSSPPSLAIRRSKQSLSRYPHYQRASVASSHGHGLDGGGGGIPTGGASSSITNLTFSESSPPLSPLTPISSSSPLYLHLPRTFRGPLTIHISSGQISDRLRLSEGLEKEVALMRESEFSRGYFVGGLGWDNADRKKIYQVRDDEGDDDGYDDGGEEEEMGGNDEVELGACGGGRDRIERTKKKTRLGRRNMIVNPVDESEFSSSSVTSSSSSPRLPSSPPTVASAQQGEWYGDRIEILVGSGDVYLQFEDEKEEDDPFCRTNGNRGLKKDVGFWKRVFTYPQGFFLL